ncbi:MAG: hypothetical protein E4G94_10110, partial [ANME-2 cluster archaeon]
DRPVAAKTLYHLGLINEKMGRQKASEYFMQLIKTYPDQTDMVVLAKSRLAALDIGPVARSTGITIRQVWSGPDADTYGSPSPDGRYLSYTDWETGDLAIRELATGIIHRLTNKGSFDESDEYAFMSSWSLNGKQIAYGWYNGNGYFELRIIGIDGSNPRILFSNKEVKWIYTYDWSPDGEQILTYFDREVGTEMIGQIVLLSTSDGSERVLKTSVITKTGGEYPENMCFSHDGRYIVYDFPQKPGYPERDIFLLSTDGIREIPLVEHPSYDELLGCAPDGKSIIFASDRNGAFS